MRVHTNPAGTLGCTITSFDASAGRRDHLAKIKELVYEHKLVVLQGQELSEQQFCDLAGQLGDPVPYLQSNYHHPDYPLIFVSSNVKKDGKEFGVARTGGYWHSDTSFLADPIPLTILYPRIVPSNTRRTTLFIDMQQAYREMPEAMKQRIRGRSLVHSGKWRYKVRQQDVGMDLTEILAMIHQAQPPVIHPAVIRHPVTGADVLYATRGFTIGVEGVGTDEGNELLAALFDFVEQQRFITEFEWTLGDVILWDNRFLAHKARRLAIASAPGREAPAIEEDTLVYRIIVRDGYPLSADASRGRASRAPARPCLTPENVQPC